MQARSDHFMPTSLLDSQYQALEVTDNEVDELDIDIANTLADIFQYASEQVKHALQTLPCNNNQA